MKLLFALFLVAGIATVAQSSNGPICNVCKALVGQLEATIENDETPIEQQANKICDALTFGSFLDSICRNLADNEIEKVEDDIRNNEQPGKVCAKLFLC